MVSLVDLLFASCQKKRLPAFRVLAWTRLMSLGVPGRKETDGDPFQVVSESVSLFPIPKPVWTRLIAD
jgi:hypothetical protein